MKRYSRSLFLLLFLSIDSSASAQFREFVTTKGDKLMEGNKELRFVSYNLPDLHYIEDNQAFTERSP